MPPPANPSYAVGTLPPGYPSALVPTGAVRVIGGLVGGNEIIAVFADSSRRLASVFEQVFEQAGFTRPRPAPASGFSPGFGLGSSFCSDSATVTAQQLIGANRDLVRVTYRRQRLMGGPPWTVSRCSASRADAWTATLIVLTTGDRRDLQLQFAMKE